MLEIVCFRVDLCQEPMQHMAHFLQTNCLCFQRDSATRVELASEPVILLLSSINSAGSKQ